VNEAKIKVGMSEPTSIYQTQAQIETLKLSLTQAIIAAETAKLTLLNDIGLDPNTKIKISSDIDIPDTRIPSEEECIAIALKNNISYLQALIQVRADERNVTVQKNAQLWTLNATGSITTGASPGLRGPDGGFPSLANGRNFNQQAGLTLSVPIDSLPTQQLLVTARVSLEQDKVNLEANKRALIINIKSQLLQLKSLYQQIKISESAVAMSQNAYEVEKKKQEIGRSSTLDVATSLTNLIQAQTNLISNKISYINAQTQLYSTLGTTLDVWRIKVRY
jgi:outer membrane protein TolC